MCRDKVIFVIGRNGRLYQYNTLSGLWHEHHQSQHLILSRLPGTAIRPSLSMECSLFMISQDGGLFEYHWNSLDGWVWFEHGTPNEEVNIAGAPGPSFEGHQLFVVGSDGKVYLRFFNGGEWKWRDYGFPDSETIKVELDGAEELKHQRNKRLCHEKESVHNAENCDAKVIRCKFVNSVMLRNQLNQKLKLIVEDLDMLYTLSHPFTRDSSGLEVWMQYRHST